VYLREIDSEELRDEYAIPIFPCKSIDILAINACLPSGAV
jgi:hypothetical protein